MSEEEQKEVDGEESEEQAGGVPGEAADAEEPPTTRLAVSELNTACDVVCLTMSSGGGGDTDEVQDVGADPLDGGDSTVSQGGLGETTADQGGPGETTADQGGPAETAADQGGLGETTADQGGPAETVADQEGPGKTTADQEGQGETTADQGGPAETTGDQGEPEDTVAAEDQGSGRRDVGVAVEVGREDIAQI